MRPRIVLLLVAPIFALAIDAQAGTVTSGTHAYEDLSPDEVYALLQDTDAFLLDVHVPNEGYLAATDARIPYIEVRARVAELPPEQDALIIVYCMTGRMSTIAAQHLVELGYRNVVNLEGGMVAWAASGYEVVPE